MEGPAGDGAAIPGAFAVLALALAGFAFSFTGFAERMDAVLLDGEWALLRAAAPRAAPDDIVVVGIDEASVRAVALPLGAWNQPLGEVLVRVASGSPRAVALAVTLPDRSLDRLRPGLDRALLVGLAAARDNAPLVATLSIDARTRSPRPIFPPYLAVLGDDGLGIDLLPSDPDGLTRRFSLLVPTEDGGFPTLVGRICARLSARCTDGLIDFALGPPLRYVAFREVLAMRDADRVRELFHNRIVLIGDARRDADRIAVPFNLATWEPPGRDAPAIAVHAQALRTALLGAAAAESPRPLAFLLAAAAASLVVVRGRGKRIAGMLAGAVALLGLGGVALHGGTYVPLGAALATLLAAGLGPIAVHAWRRRPRRFVP